jgi:AhpD family alkylhydroperoxidase
MTTATAAPTTDQILQGMSASMNGRLPQAIKLAAAEMPDMVAEHARDSQFAMPKDGGALDDDTRTLIYLGVALATGSHACVEAMMNKARTAGIEKAKILETFKIARFAEATRVFGNAERLLEQLSLEW